MEKQWCILFTFLAAVFGAALLLAWPAAATAGSDGLHVAAADAPVAALSAAEPITYTLSAGPEDGPESASLPARGYVVAGRVVDLYGQPFPGVEMRLGESITTVTGVDGSFEFAEVQPGALVLTPFKIGYAFAPTSTLVNPPPDARGRNFTGTISSKISGRLVSSQTGQPLVGARLNATRNGGGMQSSSDSPPPFSIAYTAQTDQDGYYSFDVVVGDYTLASDQPSLIIDPLPSPVSVPPDVEGCDLTGIFRVFLPLISLAP